MSQTSLKLKRETELIPKCPHCKEDVNTVSYRELQGGFWGRRYIYFCASCPPTNCSQLVGVHWLFRSVFFVIILVATLFTVSVVLIDQGLYAALLMISVPIGAIGFIKARFCPLVVKRRKLEPRESEGDMRRPLPRD